MVLYGIIQYPVVLVLYQASSATVSSYHTAVYTVAVPIPGYPYPGSATVRTVQHQQYSTCTREKTMKGYPGKVMTLTALTTVFYDLPRYSATEARVRQWCYSSYLRARRLDVSTWFHSLKIEVYSSQHQYLTILQTPTVFFGRRRNNLNLNRPPIDHDSSLGKDSRRS